MKKEREKAEKAAKIAEKAALKEAKAKAAAAAPAKKKEKSKQPIEELPKYVEKTPKGQKKSRTRPVISGVHPLTYYSPRVARRCVSQSLYPLCGRIGVVRLVGEGRLSRA